MDRNSFFYKARRKLQALAYDILPHHTLSKIYYKLYLKESLNLEAPQTFNEKLQWYKLNYCPNDSLIIQCTDKYQVRSYLKDKEMTRYLTHLLGVWTDARDIDWDTLPQKFVLKCTHGCAYNILCADKEAFDKEAAIRQLNGWLKEDFSKFNVEVHYGKITPRRIICEEYLGDVITDYKFFCFNGTPQFFYVSTDLVNDREAEMGFYNMDGSKIPLVRHDYKDIGELEIPTYLDEMVQAAERLSKDFPFVRVDFFITKNTFKFAELTFTPGAGMMPINPKKYDIEWGDFFKFPLYQSNKVYK